MNTKGNQYGNVRPNGNQFIADGWNPIKQKGEYLGSYKTEEEADTVLNDFNYRLFENNTWMLPRCISINRRDKAFIFIIQVKNKTMRISQSKSLDTVMNDKYKFINKLIS